MEPSTPAPPPWRIPRSILVAIIGAMLLVGIGAYAGRQYLAHRRLALWEPLLHSSDPEVSLRAATEITSIDPYHREARLTEARALLEKGMHHQAREVLESIGRQGSVDPGAPGLQAQAFVTQAVEIVQRTPPTQIATVRGEVEELLMYAAQRREDFALTHKGEPAVALLEAGELDARARLAYKTLRSPEMLAAAAPTPTRALAAVRKGLIATDEKLGMLCNRVRRLEPQDQMSRVILMHAAWRAGDRKAALALASEVADLPRISRYVAGELADTLLDLDRVYGLPVTAEEVDAAGRLLEHPALAGSTTLRFETAMIRLKLARGDGPGAEEAARRLLQSRPADPRLTTLLAEAMVQRGVSEEAVALLKPMAEQTQFAEIMGAYGRVLLISGDKAQAELWLQQSLKRDNDNLPVRLALIESLISGGGATQAEQDILAAAALSPNHPRVRGYRVALLVDKVDRRELAAVLATRGANLATPAVAVLACAMALDDVAWVEKHPLPAGVEGEVFQEVADPWSHGPADQRMKVALTIVRAVIAALEPDPLTLAEARRPIYELKDPPPIAGPASLRHDHFVPDLLTQARDMMALAEARWPDDAGVREFAARLALWDTDSPSAGELSNDPSTRRWVELCAARAGRQPDAVADALRNLLRANPWNDGAAMAIIGDAMKDLDERRVSETIEQVRQINPRLSTLCRARINLALRDAPHASADARTLVEGESRDSELRVLAADLAARSALTMGNPEVAAAAFQSLAISMPDRAAEMRLLGAEALREGGRDAEAAAVLADLAVSDLMEAASPWLVDRVLARASRALPAAKLLGVIERMQENRTNDPLVMIYRGQAQLALGDASGARVTLQRVEPPAAESRRAKTLADKLAAAAISAAATQP